MRTFPLDLATRRVELRRALRLTYLAYREHRHAHSPYDSCPVCFALWRQMLALRRSLHGRG